MNKDDITKLAKEAERKNKDIDFEYFGDNNLVGRYINIIGRENICRVTFEAGRYADFECIDGFGKNLYYKYISYPYNYDELKKIINEIIIITRNLSV